MSPPSRTKREKTFPGIPALFIQSGKSTPERGVYSEYSYRVVLCGDAGTRAGIDSNTTTRLAAALSILYLFIKGPYYLHNIDQHSSPTVTA